MVWSGRLLFVLKNQVANNEDSKKVRFDSINCNPLHERVHTRTHAHAHAHTHQHTTLQHTGNLILNTLLLSWPLWDYLPFWKMAF